MANRSRSLSHVCGPARDCGTVRVSRGQHRARVRRRYPAGIRRAKASHRVYARAPTSGSNNSVHALLAAGHRRPDRQIADRLRRLLRNPAGRRGFRQPDLGDSAWSHQLPYSRTAVAPRGVLRRAGAGPGWPRGPQHCREARDRPLLEARAEPRPVGTEVAATARTIPRARSLRQKAGVRISAAPSSPSLALSPRSERRTGAM